MNENWKAGCGMVSGGRDAGSPERWDIAPG